ncbi:MAG TPA: cytochrome c maturation protein CcmE [Ktedonobacteraceae bacterium]|nr:cytochrome c maturation protein CcmE [Ktedonobacteraceae bacterium]
MQTTVSVPQEEGEKPSRRRRKRLPISFILGGLVILGAVIYLIYANTQANAAYYLTVSELKSCTTCAAQSIRVAGVVQAGSVVNNEQNQQISFVIADGGQSLPVVYSGIVPDIFRPGVTVVVEGHYTGTGPFQAQTLLTKCPSKFQAATPGT